MCLSFLMSAVGLGESQPDEGFGAPSLAFDDDDEAELEAEAFLAMDGASSEHEEPASASAVMRITPEWCARVKAMAGR